MHHIKVEMNIAFTGKWHSGSGEGGFFVDRLLRQDSHKRPYIPASTLRGVLREQCEKLTKVLGLQECTDPHSISSAGHYPFHKLQSPVDQLFGTKYCQSDLYFQDAKMDYEPFYPAMNISRCSISRALRSARQKHLFQTEYANKAVLKTSIRGWHRDLTVLEQDFLPLHYIILLLGLQSIERLGGDKSTGKGNCQVNILEIVYNQQVLTWDGIENGIMEILELWDEYKEQEGL